MLNFPFNIEVQSNSAIITGTEDSGAPYRKTVSLESLCSILAQSSGVKETTVPIGCRYVVENNSFSYYIFTSPAFVGNYHVTWGSSAYDYLPENWEHNIDASPFTDFSRSLNAQASSIRTFSVPYPATCIIAKMVKQSNGVYNLHTMYAYALASELGSVKDLQLYHWPYSNVYDDARVCTGHIVKEYKTIEAIGSVPNTFFNSVCNNDLFYPNECLTKQASTDLGAFRGIWGFLAKMHGRQTMPLSWLVPSNITLGDWLSFEKVNN